MDYTNAPQRGIVNGFNYGPANRTPNAHDYELLNSNAMYGSGHTDGGGGGGGGRPGAAGGTADPFAFREVGQWGLAVSRDGHGRPDTFVLDLGNGRRKITHVYWVPGFRPQSEHMHD